MKGTGKQRFKKSDEKIKKNENKNKQDSKSFWSPWPRDNVLESLWVALSQNESLWVALNHFELL